MKPSLFLAIMISFFAANDGHAQDLCSKKEKEYGKRFISCQQVGWDANPISGDYQPKNSAPMTALPAEVEDPKTHERVYLNAYPGIVNTRLYFDGQFYSDPAKKGIPLAAKFIAAIKGQGGANSEIIKWLSEDWYKSQQPKKEFDGWEGKCSFWSGWSMDPQLQKVFADISDGILCNGIPFSRGELKEIVTALYPEPNIYDRKKLNGFFSGVTARAESLEDANVALSKLGLLGTGDFKPDQAIDIANAAKASGRNLMMDKDAGSETWNQPIKQVTDVAYNDGSINEWETLSSADFVASGENERSRSIYTQLNSIEKDFTVGLVNRNGVSTASLCNVRKLLDENCDDLNSQLSLTDQVNVFNGLKKIAYEKKVMKFKQSLALVKHELIIEYGDENTFASAKPDHTTTQSYTYVVVHAVENGKRAAPIRSQWAPPTRKLSAMCKDQSTGGRVTGSIARPIDLEKVCPDVQKGADREVFAGSVPPHSLNTFKATPMFSSSDTQARNAYNAFLSFIGTCQKFDSAAQFWRDFDRAILDNQISAEEATSLKAAYPAVKGMIDHDWLKFYIDQKQNVQGLPQLQQQLLGL